MKKFLLMTLACLLFACSASANSWGLRGGVINIVEPDDRYEDYYTAIADSGDQLVMDCSVNQAILKNRYHAVLIAAWRNAGNWDAVHISTTAVYQPGDKRGESPNNPVLSHNGGGFTMDYGDSETISEEVTPEDSAVYQLVVTAKTELEKIREQVQNVE